MNERLNNFIENSFLGPLLGDDKITDISYNGKDIFYQHNEFGRKKSDIQVTHTQAVDFIRQIANLSECMFSFQNPILDVSCGRFRINAIHPSIGRVDYDKSLSFSIRIASKQNRIEEDSSFMPKEAMSILLGTIKRQESIVIAGKTGTGKTELQKYLLSKLKDNSRIIVIDNLQELEGIRGDGRLDMTSWSVSLTNKEANFQNLIRNALRSNPDWLIVSEARGKEMLDVLNSSMTGHPLITTIHAKDVYLIPQRMARMVLMADNKLIFSEVLKDIKQHFPVLVFLDIESIEGKLHRYVSKIARTDSVTLKMDIIYQAKNEIKKSGFVGDNHYNYQKKERISA